MALEWVICIILYRTVCGYVWLMLLLLYR